MAPINECMKKGVFEWSTAAQKAFEDIKQKLCQAPILLYQTLEIYLSRSVIQVELGYELS